MLTCLCDAYYGEVGLAAVKVLEHLGCEVEFDARQTCCGQPPFNAGDWDSSRKVADHCREVLFADDVPVVIPSGSCTAMVRDGYPMLYEGSVGGKAFELGEYIVRELGVSTIDNLNPYPRKVALHRACHGRAIGLRNEQEILLSGIPGIELMTFGSGEQCCGFGGAFSAFEGKLSSEIGLEKLRQILDSGAEEIVSGDMGCLMHLKGLIDRHSMPLRVRHFAEVLAEVISK